MTWLCSGGAAQAGGQAAAAAAARARPRAHARQRGGRRGCAGARHHLLRAAHAHRHRAHAAHALPRRTAVRLALADRRQGQADHRRNHRILRESGLRTIHPRVAQARRSAQEEDNQEGGQEEGGGRSERRGARAAAAQERKEAQRDMSARFAPEYVPLSVPYVASPLLIFEFALVYA